MKTFFLIPALMFMSIIVQSQDITKTRMLPAQMSSGELKDSTCVIKLDETIGKGEYYIFTTDIDKPLDLYVAKKEKTYFVIKSKTQAIGVFDYVIYVKRLIIIDESKDADKTVQKK
jgi:hypothetical protein